MSVCLSPHKQNSCWLELDNIGEGMICMYADSSTIRYNRPRLTNTTLHVVRAVLCRNTMLAGTVRFSNLSVQNLEICVTSPSIVL